VRPYNAVRPCNAVWKCNAVRLLPVLLVLLVVFLGVPSIEP
jgi:hypothetical protein